jgi:amino-acid N-acetyltransferase
MACEPATGDDLPAIISMLAACGLPTEDVREAPGTVQLVWREDGMVVGTVGVDVVGERALLRSLAVAPAQRGRGLGRALAAAAELRAVEAGARTLLLLTESADALALACGFTEVSRCALDPGVTVFRQFSAGCCAGATCYLKRVGLP